jgi:hypothetical protein
MLFMKLLNVRLKLQNLAIFFTNLILKSYLPANFKSPLSSFKSSNIDTLLSKLVGKSC